MSAKSPKIARRLLPVLLAAVATAALAAPALAQRVDNTVTKSTATLKGDFADAVRDASRSTVRVLVEDAPTEGVKSAPMVPAAYGTVIAADGFILTKSSEIINHKQVFVKLAGKGGEPKFLEAKIVGVRESYDLAMLKIDVKDLIPVKLANTEAPAGSSKPAPQPPVLVRGGRRGLSQPTGPIPVVAPAPPATPGAVAVVVGEFVITPEAVASEGKDLDPKNYGVISVERRKIPFASGVLGVSLDDYVTTNSPQPQGALVTNVYMQSGAGRAGVKPDDVITAMDGSPVRSGQDLRNLIHKHYPTDTVTLSITRGNQTMSLKAQLGDTILATPEDMEMAVLSGQVNTRSSDFQAVFQHDTILAPSDMGGPLVDLDGHVIGINIARAGRTETFAIPADLLTERWLDSMKDGTFAPKSRD